MKEAAEYLLPFQSYAKILMTKIHPDRHHGYPNVQKINASVTSIINELFKFKFDLAERCHQIHNLHFFTWKADRRDHEEIYYKLLFNNPFDRISAKSSLNLFKMAQIPVNFSILDCFADQNQHLESNSNTKSSISKDINDGIKKSCFNLDQIIPENDLSQVRVFFRSRPYIQFDNNFSVELPKILRIGTFLMHTIQRLESRMGSKIPLIIISDTYTVPQLYKGVIHIPLSSSFIGNLIYFVIILYLY
jgi:serine/threonine protein kinase